MEQQTSTTREKPLKGSYWADFERKLMYKVLSPTEACVVQVHGRDLNKSFTHRHEKITFPSQERLLHDLSTLEESNANAWEDMMIEYLQVNKEKLEVLNAHRQRQFERGILK